VPEPKAKEFFSGHTDSFINSNLLVVTMEINYDEIKGAVLEIAIDETGDLLSYRGRDYYIDPISPAGPIGEFHASTEYDGADIYIWDKVPKKFRRAIILHEVIEADLHIHQWLPQNEAHERTVPHDRRYARETLDSKTFLEYEEFRKNGNEFFS
jgi:hypothetical protein